MDHAGVLVAASLARFFPFAFQAILPACRRLDPALLDYIAEKEGLNLAGVETVLSLERELERARAEVSRMRQRAEELEQQMTEEIERARTALRNEIVPYGKYDRVSIPIERTKKR